MPGLKKIPVGIEDFREIRTRDAYYIDKTRLIEQLIENWSKVNLFTRPRRFGKTLNMSMLKTFFEIGTDKAFLMDSILHRIKSYANSILENIRSYFFR